MNAQTAETLIQCHRPWRRPENSRLAKAVKQAGSDAALKSRLDEQVAFDDRQLGMIGRLVLPPELVERLAQAGHGGAHRSPRTLLRDPAVLAGVIGVLLILGLVVFFAMQGMRRFPGDDAVFDMVDTAQRMSGMEVEPVEAEIGRLGDWLFMKYALENYQVAPDLAAAHAAGCRVFKQKGHPIAQIIVGQPQAVLYVFKAADFGVRIDPQNEWRFFEREEWSGAAASHGDSCTVVTVRGGTKEAREALEKLTGKPAR
jgi:hypothetical protein